ncbi:colicin release lysis protein [Klebsiella pneumoniae]|uniref:colicin release lysis protein n=1 Tax=Klebsiella pneumoniae TaxID=573 RepID=UPI001E4854B4|nr:colicin release lysis protein [Klebsiella pneumoniae]
MFSFYIDFSGFLLVACQANYIRMFRVERWHHRPPELTRSWFSRKDQDLLRSFFLRVIFAL